MTFDFVTLPIFLDTVEAASDVLEIFGCTVGVEHEYQAYVVRN